MWLANFKNWFKHTYPGQQVEFKSDIVNIKLAFRKTLCVGDAMLISRKSLVKHIPIFDDDAKMEVLVRWLNN
ncbi:hypothetical protein J6T66_03260 [bacterium]|nr:hypothetical protein [bacterium]